MDETHEVEVTEYVEEYEYIPQEIYVWRVETYDTILYQKSVKPSSQPVKTVEVDDITITREQIKIPEITFEEHEVIINDPVSISNEPVPVPNFVNQVSLNQSWLPMGFWVIG